MCGNEFLRHRPTARFCKDGGCQKRRQKQRWEKWKEAREADGTFREIENQRQYEYRLRTGYARDYELRTKYGITLKEWQEMVDKVGGKCEICGKADEALCVDHCHQTKQVRGVLCRKCNRAIGQLGDTAEDLKRALAYLERASND